MKPYLEHANIAFQDLEGAIQFFQTAFPSFEVRHRGDTWLHIGTDESYIAINEAKSKAVYTPYVGSGLNHLGFVVENVAELGERLEKAGYKRSYETVVQSFRRREYFFDHEGNDYEFVEYFSEKTEERNDYND